MKNLTKFEGIEELVGQYSAEYPRVKMSELTEASLSGKAMTLTFGESKFVLNQMGTDYLLYRLHETRKNIVESEVPNELLADWLKECAKQAKTEELFMSTVNGVVWGTPSTYLPVPHSQVIEAVKPMEKSFRSGFANPAVMRLIFASEAMAEHTSRAKFGAMVRNGMTGVAAFSVASTLYTAKGRAWQITKLTKHSRHIDGAKLVAVSEAIATTIEYDGAVAFVDFTVNTKVRHAMVLVTDAIGRELTESEKKRLLEFTGERTLDELLEFLIDKGFTGAVISAMYASVEEWLAAASGAE